MPTNKTITIPDGYTEVTILFPTGRVQSAIDTFAEIGGYDPATHGATPALKAAFATNAMAEFLDSAVTNRDARIMIANATAASKIRAL